jgi:serine/threonine protein kinase
VYLVLEYVSGRDLGKLVQEKGPLPVPEAVGFAIQAARGLAYAHNTDIIHRDLKPTNLLLTSDGLVKIADMGLARFSSTECAAELTMKGLAIGTPEYMAPEQAEDASNVDARCDIYSLGATLFHLLTGNAAVVGSSYFHKLQKLLTSPPRPLAEVRPDVPEQLARVVDWMRARRPEDRPQTAEEAIALLEPFAPAPFSNRKLEPQRLADLVLEVLRGAQRAEAVCEQYGLTAAEWDKYQSQFIDAGRRALDPKASAGASEEECQKLHARIGAQHLQIEELKRQLRFLSAQSNPPTPVLYGKH